MADGKSSFIADWVIPIMGLAFSIASTIGTFLTVPAARLASLRQRLGIICRGIPAAVVCCLFVAIPFIPQSAGPSVADLCNLPHSGPNSYPSLSIQQSRSTYGNFLEVRGHEFLHNQTIDVTANLPGRGWSYGSRIVQSTANGYFEATILLSEYASGSLCIFAHPRPDPSGGLEEIDASYNPRFMGIGVVTID